MTNLATLFFLITFIWPRNFYKYLCNKEIDNFCTL